MVINLAQLNIGFARAQNEIAVVEIQGDYPRAHVARYTALYTSLVTGYGFRFETRRDDAAVSHRRRASSFRMLLGESYRDLTCRRGDDTDWPATRWARTPSTSSTASSGSTSARPWS